MFLFEVKRLIWSALEIKFFELYFLAIPRGWPLNTGSTVQTQQRPKSNGNFMENNRLFRQVHKVIHLWLVSMDASTKLISPLFCIHKWRISTRDSPIPPTLYLKVRNRRAVLGTTILSNGRTFWSDLQDRSKWTTFVQSWSQIFRSDRTENAPFHLISNWHFRNFGLLKAPLVTY